MFTTIFQGDLIEGGLTSVGNQKRARESPWEHTEQSGKTNHLYKLSCFPSDNDLINPSTSQQEKTLREFLSRKVSPCHKIHGSPARKKNNYNNSYWTQSCFIIKKLLHSPRRKNSKEKRHVTFAIFLKKRTVEDVNFIQRTWYCLSNSIGGCAPYVSSFGMFKSSTKMIIRLPAGAPKATNIASSH